MKNLKLIVLSLFLLSSGKCISQSVTQERNSASIDTSICHFIAIDLVKGDVCQNEKEILYDNIKKLNQKINEKDSINFAHALKENNFAHAIDDMKKQNSAQKEISDKYLTDKNKAEHILSIKSFSAGLYKLLSIALATALGGILLFK